MKLLGMIKRKLEYFIRPELSIQIQMANVIALASLVIMVPAVFFSMAFDTIGEGIIAEIILAVWIIVFIWVINANRQSQLPITIMMVIVDLGVFPFMYFMCGGIRTGMPIWMLLGAVFAMLLLKGAYKFFIFVINGVAFVSCVLTEYYYPQRVARLLNEEDNYVDTMFAFVFVIFIIGVVFELQRILFERQKTVLKRMDEQLRKANTKLEEASQAKSDFLANMSHEIRTPINAMLGMDEMIMRDAKDPIVLGYAKDIDSAGKQLLSLVNDILDFSKIESGKFSLTLEDYDMFSIINDCYNMGIGRANEKKLNFLIENNPKLPAKLYGDEVRIRQIAINFLTNAIKYTENGTITLKFDMEPVSEEMINLIVSVKDTGIGISEKNLGNLFEMFTRVDERLHRNIEGTGLGLAISKQLSELMNGKIYVESTVGVGSVFTVVIPQKVTNATPMGKFEINRKEQIDVKKPRRQSFTAEKASVLIVDDVRVNLNVVRLLLRDTRIQMDLAESGMEALEYIKRKHYDVVLMDHMMPDMDGIETLKKIRLMDDNENQFVPIIALTANAVQGVEKMYLESGFCDYITKPVRAPELESALLKYLPETLVEYTK